MPAEPSVINALKALKDRQTTDSQYQVAADDLYRRYVTRVVELARKKIPERLRRIADEEDVAQAALKSFFSGVKKARFLKLDDATDLWQILVMLTERKANDQIRRQVAKKRGGGRVRGESAFESRDAFGSCAGGVGDITGVEPTPEFAAEVAEEFQRRIQQLDQFDDGVLHNKTLRRIALWRFEGLGPAEIAKHLGCVTRTVERRLALIRKIWESS
jgi:RNA polymerase sigma factor (sigma-70 family)